MTRWMLVSREWLSIAVPIFLRDVWATCGSIQFHLFANWRPDSCLLYKLAGITDLKQYLAQNCRSLTVSVYQVFEGEYERQCTEMAEYAADKSDSISLPSRRRLPHFGIPLEDVARVIRDFLPNTISLHFVLVDCVPTSFWQWYMHRNSRFAPDGYPDTLTNLHITFTYTSPPPPLLIDAARGTFFPPRRPPDNLLHVVNFDSIKRLVVREANADFVAFFTTLCPKLECIESTAEFGLDDLPPKVAAKLEDRLVFRELAPTTDWGITGSDISAVRPKEDLALIPTEDSPPTALTREATLKNLETKIALHVRLAEERKNMTIKFMASNLADRKIYNQSALLQSGLEELQLASSYATLGEQLLEYDRLICKYTDSCDNYLAHHAAAIWQPTVIPGMASATSLVSQQSATLAITEVSKLEATSSTRITETPEIPESLGNFDKAVDKHAVPESTKVERPLL
ncbi:hypothetical protein FB45DRAFT_1067494 [Roridomyces roridus]|uniref:Uncharacterized protein n=1 Tax=Roridomyces roridus TaxID=1738132 RepID=A0AAD7B2E2_9AGAR|nr:hypothetical protein FB45DRAFT_1067494 [Roridomyces roridus]